ncbi:5'/3'-nucleotidase SurE, partial [Klebsiella pneumoniae]|nr:5'/3'-nucleotidase SurE [Klebsiella pneumoniae]
LTLKHEEPGLQVWSCNGTPVDCVKMALAELCRDRRPDLIIGGINHGDNASVNTHYSGTMGVVMEGCMKYIPSVAYSLC